jgi:hypothetical protein
MNWMERDIIDRKHYRTVFVGWRRIAPVAFEREIVTAPQINEMQT